MLYKYNNKSIARKAYNEGETVQLLANKLVLGDLWVDTFEISKENTNGLISSDFDTRVNNFEYHNCNFEMGYYTSFYVEVVTHA